MSQKSRKRPLILSESENESQDYRSTPVDKSSVIKSTYRDTWLRFYKWNVEDSRITLQSLRAKSTRRKSMPVRDRAGLRSGPTTRSTENLLGHESFTIIEYDERGENSAIVPLRQTRDKGPLHVSRSNLSYESCTPISRNIKVGDDPNGLAFLPFADDPTFDWKDFTDQYGYCVWQKSSCIIDPCEWFITMLAARELAERRGISVEEFDRTAVSPIQLLNSGSERRALYNDSLGDWFRHFNARTEDIYDMSSSQPFIQPAQLTETSQINLGTAVFCNNLNCIISCCTTHFEEMPTPFAVTPTLTSKQLSNGILEPCDSQCFLLVQTNPIPYNWTTKELDTLILVLRSSPDTSPCDLAVICKKPCFEAFRWRKRLINDNKIGKTKPERKAKVGRPSSPVFQDYDCHKFNPKPPCSHNGPCDEQSDCACFKNNAHCEHACHCDRSCQRRWKGCQCSSNSKRYPICGTDRCSCFRARRECDPELCLRCDAKEPDSDRCRNVSIQRELMKDVEVREGAWGLGCFVLEPVTRGEFILEYVGELLYEATVLSRDAISTHRDRNYVFTLNDVLTIDARRAGNESRYINHDAARTNCRAAIKLVNGEHRIGLYATRDLAPGEELLLNYGPNFFRDKPSEVVAEGDVPTTGSTAHGRA